MAFKMKGHTLPGIKQLKSSNLDDGRSGSAAFQQSDPFAGSGKKNNDNVGQISEFRAMDQKLPIRFDPPLIRKFDTSGESSKKPRYFIEPTSFSDEPFKQSDPFAGSKKGPYDEGDTSMATATITKKATEIPFVDQTTVYPDIADLRSGDHQGIVKDLPNEVFKGNKNTGDGADVDSDKYSRYLSTL